ncbi:MAG: MFS transporter [Acidobacteriales bacterium 59-55]|nr:MFS transporter [Terriglobales bacterium]OJV43654.1 MAG: MFS transporter [Acidobacteriales bacterium 59-55]
MTETSTSATRQGSSYKWLVVGMLWFVCFFNYADRQAIFSVFPLIKEQLHLSDVELGVIGGSFMWMYAIFGPFAGWLCDRLPRKTLVLGGLIFWSVVTAATAVTHNYMQLTICRALGGLGEAFYFPAAMSLISDYHGAATRSRAMSLHQSSVYAGSIAGGAVSGFIGEYYGWRSSFVLFGIAGIILGLLLWGLLREPVRGMSEAAESEGPADEAQSPVAHAHPGGGMMEGFREVLRNRMVRLLIFVFIGANFVAVVFLTWMPTFLYQKFHMSLSMAGLNSTVYLQIASVLGVLSGGWLADVLVRRMTGGRLLTQSLGLLCGVPFLFLTGWTTSVPFLILAMVGFGYFKGLYDANIFAGLYDVVPVERRGVAAGVLNSLGWLGAGFAPVSIALGAAHYGMSACISATAGIYLFIGLLLLWGARRVKAVAA